MALFRTSMKFKSISSLSSFSVIHRTSAKITTSELRHLDLRTVQGTKYGVNSSMKCGGYKFKPALCHSCSIHADAVVLNSATEKPQKGAKGSSEGSVFQQIMETKEQPKQLTVGGKVLQAGKDMTYLVIVVGGLLFTAIIFYNVTREFWATDSPSVVYAAALKRLKNDPRVVDVLGESISGFGEASGRNRRRHIPHQEYVVDGETYMRVKFFVKGSKRKGTAIVDLKKNSRGVYECRFLILEFPGGSILVEDNR